MNDLFELKTPNDLFKKAKKDHKKNFDNPNKTQGNFLKLP